MRTTPLDNVTYLHDATVSDLALRTTGSGEREVRLRLHCDGDCGYDAWNDRTIQVTFVDPLIVNVHLYGHMSNVDSFNTWGAATSERIIDQVEKMKAVGIPIPKHLVELVFHSGSVLEVACDEIRFAMTSR